MQHINGVNKTNIKDRTYYFYNDIIDIKTFDSKNRTKFLIFTILDILQLKKLVMVMMLIA